MKRDLKILSSKSLFTTISILSNYIQLSATNLSLNLGFSLGNMVLVFLDQETYGTLDLIKYRMIEEVSGLGFSVYFINLGLFDNEENLLHEDKSFFDFELNWEPVYRQFTELGLGLFCRLGGYIPEQDQLD